MKKGIKMGLFSSIASLARIGGPIISNSVSHYFGYNRLWLMMAAVLIFTTIFHVAIYHYLRPLSEVLDINSTTEIEYGTVPIKEKTYSLNQLSSGSYPTNKNIN